MKYLFESSICLAILYAFYWILLRRQTFFQLNRAYLLGSVLVSAIIPALKMPVDATIAPIEAFSVQTDWGLTAPIQAYGWSLTLGDILTGLYCSIAACLIVLFALRCLRLWQLIRQNQNSTSQIETAQIVPIQGEAPTASFFNIIFFNTRLPQEGGEFILAHELVHVRQWHTLDLLLTEALAIVQWFNPLIYVFKRSLRVVHEYIADEQVVFQTNQRFEYAQLLVYQAKQQSKTPNKGKKKAGDALLNTFHSHLKQRLTMLAQHPSAPSQRVRYLLAIPLATTLLILFSFRMAEHLPGVTPVYAAIEKADNYIAALRQVEIVADQRINTIIPATATPDTYIFYWKDAQTTLRAENDYNAVLEMTPAQLLNTIYATPFLWSANEKRIIDPLKLNIDGLEITASKSAAQEFGENASWLYPRFHQAKPGRHFLITKIGLPNGKYGTITVQLIQPAHPENNTSVWPLQNISAATTAPVQPATHGEASWGLVEKDRHFYTVSEFWEIVQQMPKVTNSNLDSSALQAMIFIEDNDGSKFGLAALLESAAYQGLWRNIDNRRHLILPNIRGAFWVQEYSSGIKLMTQFFTLVDDNDPRLALRANRDQHNLTIEWSGWNGSHKDLYLKNYTLSDGQTVYADAPQTWRVEYSDNTAKDETAEALQRAAIRQQKEADLIQSRPVFKVDGQVLQHVSFIVEVDKVSYTIGPDQLLPAAVQAVLQAGLKEDDFITIHNIKAYGYDLKPLIYEIFWPTIQSKSRKCLDITTCQQVKSDASIQLSAPTPNPSGGDVSIRFDLPAEVAASLYVFRNDGWNAYMDTEKRTAGVNTLVIPHSAFAQPGLYYIFLETPDGVAQQQVMIKE